MSILAMALQLIPPVEIQYYKGKGRKLNAIGLWEGELCEPAAMEASVQPVPRKLYQVNGLDFQSNYYTVFLDRDLIDIERDVSGDQIGYKGMRLQALSKTDWFQYDGWDEVLCVEIPKK